MHTLALKPDGTVYAWGRNYYGQLGEGVGVMTDSSVPVPVLGLTGVVAVDAGDSHSVALKSDGTVWCWGVNNTGQLGDGTTTSSRSPVQVSGLTGVVAIAAAELHNVALKSDGTVWAWGGNSYGQFGDGTTTWSPTPVQVLGLTGVTQIAASFTMTAALKSDGTVWCCGANGAGQLGNGTFVNSSWIVQASGLTGVVAIAGDTAHTVALKSDGTVWAWGSNARGQFGNGTTSPSNIPIQIPGLSNVVKVTTGWSSIHVIKSDGTLWGLGWNVFGQLGDGTTIDRSAPVQMSGMTGVLEVSVGGMAGAEVHTVVAKLDGTVWVCGGNYFGQWGNGTITDTYPNPPVQVVGLTGILADYDGDGIDNPQDADPFNPMVDWVVTPEKTYEWIAIPDAPAGYVAVDMNSHGQILFRREREDFGTAIWPDILQSSPIGKICDPTISGAGRWKDIYFKPGPFNLRVYYYATDVVGLHSIPLPMVAPDPDVYGATHGLSYVMVAALGDDGSVMANVSYRYNYYNGHPEDHQISSCSLSTYVFKWAASDYETCYLHGDDRGWQGDTESYSCNKVAGYQTLPGAGPTDPPVVNAVIFDEIKTIAELPHSVSLVQAPFFSLGTSHVLQTGRRHTLDLLNYNVALPYSEFSHKGRVLLWKDYIAPDMIFTVGLAGTIGFTTVTDDPYSVFEIPAGVGGAGRWGLTLGNVNHLITGSSAISMGMVGVLQLDNLGTGIGDRDGLRDIWRNGTWRTVGSMTTNASFIPGSLVLKKIGRTGVIWAGNGTVEGIFLPNP